MEEVADFIYDLEWVGGNRDPEHDIMFDSLSVVGITVKYRREKKGG